MFGGIFIQILIEHSVSKYNSGDPDQTPRSALFAYVPQKDAMLIWVKHVEVSNTCDLSTSKKHRTGQMPNSGVFDLALYCLTISYNETLVLNTFQEIFNNIYM